MKIDTIIPKCAWITVNRNCNLRCKWCYAKETDYLKGGDMSLDFAKEIVTLINSLNIKRITIIGGEPTLWPFLLEFNDFCKNLNIETTLVTNAIRFSNDDFWENYKKSPNTKAGVSVKAYDLISLMEACSVNNIDQIEIGIKRVTEFFNCGVSFVYNTLLENNIIDITEFAVKNGAKFIGISPCTPMFNQDTVENNYMIEIDTFVSKIVNNYKKLCEITNGKISFTMKTPLCLWPKDFIENIIEKNQISSICQVQQKSGLIFDTDGKILMCNSLFNYPLGLYGKDFTNKDSLLSLLNSPEVVDYYDKINYYPSKKCIGCSKYAICGGGCPLIWAVYNPEDKIKGWD